MEFFGPGVCQLSASDRTTIANMCPEYNATVSFFPVDDVALKHFKHTSKMWSACCHVMKAKTVCVFFLFRAKALLLLFFLIMVTFF